MTDSNAFENDIPSDALDAMADLAYEQREVMMECNPSDFQMEAKPSIGMMECKPTKIYTSNHELNTEPTT
jgi:hypothetical protein